MVRENRIAGRGGRGVALCLSRSRHNISYCLFNLVGGLTNYAFREDDKQRGIAIGTMISFMALGSVGSYFSLIFCNYFHLCPFFSFSLEYDESNTVK